MKIKRVVRFQSAAVEKIKMQQNFETVTEDVNLNKDIITKENLKENVENLEGKSSPSASKLRECVRRVFSQETSTNLIGVFGINSDVAVGQLRKELEETDRDLQWIGTVEAPISETKDDIYNVIVRQLYYFLYINTSKIWTTLEKDEILSLVYKVTNREAGLIGNPMRTRAVLECIDKIMEMLCWLKPRSYFRECIIAIEMEKMDYFTLNKLDRLKSSNLAIIVYSLLDYNLASRSFEDLAEIGPSVMNKFFSINNCVYAS